MLARGYGLPASTVQPWVHLLDHQPPSLHPAQLYESEWKSRRSIVSTFSPGNREATPQVLFDRNYEDAYTGLLLCVWS